MGRGRWLSDGLGGELMQGWGAAQIRPVPRGGCVRVRQDWAGAARPSLPRILKGPGVGDDCQVKAVVGGRSAVHARICCMHVVRTAAAPPPSSERHQTVLTATCDRLLSADDLRLRSAVLSRLPSFAPRNGAPECPGPFPPCIAGACRNPGGAARRPTKYILLYAVAKGPTAARPRHYSLA